MSSLQIAATVFSLIYIFFATKNKAICFLFGAIAAICWAYESFYNLNLKFDAVLQVFYLLMSFYGAYKWSQGKNGKTQSIQQHSLSTNLILVGFGILLSFACAKIALSFFQTNYAYLDALTTGLSIIATFLLTKRYIENWIYWLVINPLYMFIYYKSGAILFVGISFIYTIMSIHGYWNWRMELAENRTSSPAANQ